MSTLEKELRRQLMPADWSHTNYAKWSNSPERELLYLSSRPTIEELQKVIHPPVDYVKELGLEEYTDGKEKKYRIKKGDKRNRWDIDLLVYQLERQKRPKTIQQIIESRKENKKNDHW